MAIRFPRPVWADWNAAFRDVVDVLTSFLRDDAQPARYFNISHSAQSLRPVVGNGVAAGLPTWDSAEAALAFTANSACTIQGSTELPRTWAEQTTVIPYAHIYPNSSATAATNACQFVFRYRWTDIGSSVPAATAWTSLSRTYTLSAGLRILQIATLSQDPDGQNYLTGTGHLIRSVIHWELTRQPADTEDSYTDTVFLTSVDFMVKQDTSRGSQRPDQKWIA